MRVRRPRSGIRPIDPPACRMRPGRIRHDIGGPGDPRPVLMGVRGSSDRYRTIRTIIDTELTGMPTPAVSAQPPGCAYDPDGHADAAYGPLLPPVRLP